MIIRFRAGEVLATLGAVVGRFIEVFVGLRRKGEKAVFVAVKTGNRSPLLLRENQYLTAFEPDLFCVEIVFGVLCAAQARADK